MKKIVVLLLLMVSTNVMAEWTNIGDSDSGEATVYVDIGAIKKKGHKVKMLKLLDYKAVQKLGNDTYLSQITHSEYDCEEETSRMLDVFMYSENMRQGKIVNSLSNIKNDGISISSIIPGTIQEALFKIACSKKK